MSIMEFLFYETGDCTLSYEWIYFIFIQKSIDVDFVYFILKPYDIKHIIFPKNNYPDLVKWLNMVGDVIQIIDT